uniref:Putative secreted peptide n=1 Tax=Anopheles braziliensis TaxID=58242 RepID=A0A2M3ZQ89_9DIPT
MPALSRSVDRGVSLFVISFAPTLLSGDSFYGKAPRAWKSLYKTWLSARRAFKYTLNRFVCTTSFELFETECSDTVRCTPEKSRRCFYVVAISSPHHASEGLF